MYFNANEGFGMINKSKKELMSKNYVKEIKIKLNFLEYEVVCNKF
jgi:hypothetical protein